MHLMSIIQKSACNQFSYSFLKKKIAAKNAELEAKLSSQHSGSMHATVEFEASKARIEALEGEKRELVAAFDRKVGELEEMNKDYQAMSTRYQELRKESSKLESEAREAKAADMSRKVCPQFLWILVRNLIVVVAL